MSFTCGMPKLSSPADHAGPAATVQPDTEEGNQWAAAVVELTPLTRQGDRTVKLFGTAGGDPAMNGLYTHVAFFDSPAEGWRVFRIGDFLEYRVLSEAPGRVDLEIDESVMDEATGQIGGVREVRRRLPAGEHRGEPPAQTALQQRQRGLRVLAPFLQRERHGLDTFAEAEACPCSWCC